MEKEEVLGELTDAADLLTMLEYLVERLPEETRNGVHIPWSGILLTVRQSRDSVLLAKQSLARDGSSKSSLRSPMSATQVGMGKGTGQRPSLADRVEQLPPNSSSRTRELLDNVSTVGPNAGAERSAGNASQVRKN